MSRLTTNIVPPEGPLKAKICFIGQSPGAEEDRALKPFIGDAGQLLNRGLKHAGILRSEVLVNNVFAQRPPHNKVKYFFESYLQKLTWEGEEHVERLKAWLEGLLKERDQGFERPNVLVALGAEALWVLTGESKITKWRGSILPCTLVPGFKVYAMFHPSYVNRLINEPEERLQGQKKVQRNNALPLFLIDLQRAKYQSEFPDFKRPEREFKFNCSLGEFVSEIRKLKESPIVAVDIETIPSNVGPMLWCIGFSKSPEIALTVPFLKKGQFAWSAKEEAVLFQEISKLFLSENVLKVTQSAYDLTVLGRYQKLRVAEGTYGDTMWLFQSIYPYLSKGLNILTSIYTWEPYYKEEGKYWDGRRLSDEAEFIYNGKDCCVTREIWPQLVREAKVKGFWKTYQNSISVLPSLIRMMITGVKIDFQKKDRLQIEFDKKAAEAKAIITEHVKYDVNPNSSAQLQRLLYGYLGMPIQYGHKSKKPAADKDCLNKLLKKYSSKSVNGIILRAISDFKKFGKLASTYTKMEVEEDGRARTSYGFVSTFRLSSSKSHFGEGGNLQNIPVKTEEGKLIRGLFVPDSGLWFIASDLGQAEARFAAYDAEDLEMIEAFESGADCHWLNTQKIFDIPEKEAYISDEPYRSPLLPEEKKKYTLRQIGKSVEYADTYGMGPVMLQNILIREEVYLELAICKRLLLQRRRKKPMILQWQARIREELRTTRTLTNPFGDKREFHGRINDNLFRSGYAWKPQSTVGRILEFGIQKIHEDLDYFAPLLNVHDEVIGQCKEEDIPRAKIAIKERLEIPLTLHGRTFVIPCGFKISPTSWGELKEV